MDAFCLDFCSWTSHGLAQDQKAPTVPGFLMFNMFDRLDLHVLYSMGIVQYCTVLRSLDLHQDVFVISMTRYNIMIGYD